MQKKKIILDTFTLQEKKKRRERYVYVYVGGSQQISPKTRRRRKTRTNQITSIHTYTICFLNIYINETINTTTTII